MKPHESICTPSHLPRLRPTSASGRGDCMLQPGPCQLPSLNFSLHFLTFSFHFLTFSSATRLCVVQISTRIAFKTYIVSLTSSLIILARISSSSCLNITTSCDLPCQTSPARRAATAVKPPTSAVAVARTCSTVLLSASRLTGKTCPDLHRRYAAADFGAGSTTSTSARPLPTSPRGLARTSVAPSSCRRTGTSRTSSGCP